MWSFTRGGLSQRSFHDGYCCIEYRVIGDSGMYVNFMFCIIPILETKQITWDIPCYEYGHVLEALLCLPSFLAWRYHGGSATIIVNVVGVFIEPCVCVQYACNWLSVETHILFICVTYLP